MLHISPKSSYTQTIYTPDAFPGTEEGSQPSRSELRITAFGIFKSKGGFANAHVSPCHNIHVILGGKGVVESAGKKFTLKRGDVFVFYPGEHIYYYDLPKTPWQYHWFLLEGTHAEWSLARAGLSRKTPGIFSRQLAGITKDIARVFTEKANPFSPVSEAWNFVEALSLACSSESSAPAPAPREKSAGLAEACRNLIESQYMTPLSIDELARQFRITRSTLFRNFRKRFGVSPKEYLDRLRLQKAEILLRDPSLSIKEIAYACGYSDPCYFTQAFRKALGMPPKTWREKN